MIIPKIPMIVANIAMFSGDVEKRLAVTVGNIKRDVISVMPMNFMETEIISEVIMIKINFIFSGCIPSAFASS